MYWNILSNVSFIQSKCLTTAQLKGLFLKMASFYVQVSTFTAMQEQLLTIRSVIVSAN